MPGSRQDPNATTLTRRENWWLAMAKRQCCLARSLRLWDACLRPLFIDTHYLMQSARSYRCRVSFSSRSRNRNRRLHVFFYSWILRLRFASRRMTSLSSSSRNRSRNRLPRQSRSIVFVFVLGLPVLKNPRNLRHLRILFSFFSFFFFFLFFFPVFFFVSQCLCASLLFTYSDF